MTEAAGVTEAPRPMMIGDFARRCRLPVSTLRYYDRIGLLAPAAVDPSNGYRRYTSGQLPAAVLIGRLRAIGSGPPAIAAVLAGGTAAGAALAAERRRVQAQVRDAHRALAELDDLLAGPDDLLAGPDDLLAGPDDLRAGPDDLLAGRALTRGGAHGYDVRLVTLGRYRVAAAPFAAPDTGVAGCILRGIAGLRTALRRSGCARAGPWGATFPLEITEQVSGLVFARARQLSRAPGLAVAWLPAARAVRTVHQRGPGTLAMAYQAVLDRIDDEGWIPAGPVIEEYLALDAPPATAPAIQVTVPLA
ncbi:MAG TPA: MerR family DNA-binding transcriptional regulator [Streptosporangiaceae bacterium]|nr:MerR family DNA-binding transcriptional regulator [Streptosporangiaceae bacterium]